ncbi:MAG TPA: CHAT domain-containing protein [Blastocatellia bacterium]|nr:CHAT domain-containing protein [Blastocatellia bacterium]
MPSISTLAVLRAETASRPPAPKMIAMFADPVFTLNEARQRNKAKGKDLVAASTPARDILHEETDTTQTTSAIARLPFTRQEAEQILALVPKAEIFRALDFEANRAAVQHPSIGQYRYLHFATHGLMDSERPGLSSLVLSLVNQQGQPQDGFLRAHELYKLRLPAEMVVLSACQTGLGKDVKGEGLMSLTRGFMYAGAARVVVSLWSVNDKATAELMTRMYQKLLQEGQRPAAALRAAQVEMWRQKPWQAPYYWAGFVLQGEWK